MHDTRNKRHDDELSKIRVEYQRKTRIIDRKSQRKLLKTLSNNFEDYITLCADQFNDSNIFNTI